VASQDDKNTMNRRAILAGMGVLPGLSSGVAKAAVAPIRDPAFIAIGDWGRRGGGPQTQVAQAMGRAAGEIDSKFTLAVGDNFYPAGVNSATDSHWKDSFEDIYTAPALQRPWYAALGNHDYRGNPQAQIDYTRRSHRWRMPARYYSVPAAISGIPDMDLFFLDTAPLVKEAHETAQQLMRGHLCLEDRNAQLKWFERALAKSTAPWKVVIGHHPVYSGAHGNDPTLIADIQPLLEKYGVQAYINGHDHDLQHIVTGPVSYICSGSGAEVGRVEAIEGTRFCASKAGFAQFVMKPNVMTLAFKDLTGASIYRADIPRLPQMAARSVRNRAA
jgi:tartrate-resistant acid phosphatase type 5